MKSLWLISALLSLTVSADRLEQQYDEKVVRHVDGLVKAMQYEFSQAIDEEFQHLQAPDDTKVGTKSLGNNKHFMPYGSDFDPYYGYGGIYPLYGYDGFYDDMDENPWTIWKRSSVSPENSVLKKRIKDEFNQEILKPFRIGALKITQEEVDRVNIRTRLMKRDDSGWNWAKNRWHMYRSKYHLHEAKKNSANMVKNLRRVAKQKLDQRGTQVSSFFDQNERYEKRFELTDFKEKLSALYKWVENKALEKHALLKQYLTAKNVAIGVATVLALSSIAYFFASLFTKERAEIDTK